MRRIKNFMGRKWTATTWWYIEVCVCPKSGYRELRCWKAHRYFLYAVNCRLEELEVFDKELAAKLRETGGSLRLILTLSFIWLVLVILIRLGMYSVMLRTWKSSCTAENWLSHIRLSVIPHSSRCGNFCTVKNSWRFYQMTANTIKRNVNCVASCQSAIAALSRSE